MSNEPLLKTFKIACPSCGSQRTISRPSDGAANDAPAELDLAAPEGFRKVQIGWRSDYVQFYCMNCGVAAVRI